ncbi:hypothetical protein THAOC_04097 [Thalassiosira oceanica]|uniref:Leucine-rich repeat domain-containing protein n=1 Tax=Thalassiosira oceanica TaxID=159749 RepID=K0TJZ5_THAOC|nr:hypothetical protein THAOC_04097 [Thalassiosira oceanica]|eukprot:EJK74236.1 hypothetical protein THAOC_04097 [Thalassiosira oceanica]
MVDIMDDDARGSRNKRQRAVSDGVFLYKGGEIEWERRSKITRVRIGPQVKEIPHGTFGDCINLVDVQFDEGLEIIRESAFTRCTALQQVAIPSSVTKLGKWAFKGCINLAEVKFNEGLEIIAGSAFYGCVTLQSVTIPPSVTSLGSWAFCNCTNLARVQLNDGIKDIGPQAFYECTALRSVTVPSSVTKLGTCAFSYCRNLTEVIFLGGERLLNQGFLDRGLLDGEKALNKTKLNEMIGNENALRDDFPLRTNAFVRCPLATLKISIPWALCARMQRLPGECRLSIEQRLHGLRRLEMTQDGNILACFPLIRRPYWDSVKDTNDETAESLHQVLRLISFHELKESSILIELAMWKSRLDEHRARADCRISVPDPAKSLIMEYCCFVRFLEPAIEGD